MRNRFELVTAALVGGLSVLGCGAKPPPPAPEPILPSVCMADSSCPFVFFSAHRGKCGEALEPENTVASFQECDQSGVPIFELDYRLTADGVPVVMHDSSVARTTDGETRYPNRTGVSQLTAAEFKQLVIDDSRCVGADVDPLRCHPPTLGEVLDHTTKPLLMIDYKSGDLHPFYSLVQEHSAQARILFFDDNVTVLTSVHAELPNATVMPRVHSADEVHQLLASWPEGVPLRIIHGDPEYAADVAGELASRSIRLYANAWLLDGEYYAVDDMSEEQQQRHYAARIWPKLDEYVQHGVGAIGTEHSSQFIAHLYPGGWGL